MSNLRKAIIIYLCIALVVVIIDRGLYQLKPTVSEETIQHRLKQSYIKGITLGGKQERMILRAERGAFSGSEIDSFFINDLGLNRSTKY